MIFWAIIIGSCIIASSINKNGYYEDDEGYDGYYAPYTYDDD